MIPGEKKAAYTDYLSQKPREIKVEIPGGPKITWTKCWDYRSSLTDVTFKTLTPSKVKHRLLKVELVDLMPVANVKYWNVTIFRQAPPAAKREKPKGKGHAHDSY